MPDFEYTTDGLFAHIMPASEPGKRQWNELAAQGFNGKVIVLQFAQFCADLKAAGYTIRKARPVRISDEDLLALLT